MSVPTPERWLPIPGFDGYEVSDQGRVMSYKGKTPRLLKLHLNTNGYIHVGIYADAKMCFRTVHGLVALAFIGPRPAGQDVRHLDDDRMHNVLSNLAHGSRKQNMEDSVRNGGRESIRKAQCRFGHPYTQDNTIVGRHGVRTCRTCYDDWQAANVAA